MAFSAPFTAVTGATITASSHNTGYRDNLNAIWVYTTAGDIVYATSSSVLQRLGIGAAGSVLTSTGSAPSWPVKYGAPGMMNAWSVAYSGATAAHSGSWALAMTSMTLNTTVTTTIMMDVDCTGYNDTSGRAFYLQGVINGAADANYRPHNGGFTTEPRAEAMHYQYWKTGVAAGAIVCSVNFGLDLGNNYVVDIMCSLKAIAE